VIQQTREQKARLLSFCTYDSKKEEPTAPGRRQARGSSMTVPTILVVEDDALLRISAMMMIKDAGYEVVGARDAEEALAVLEDRSDICLVFTDVDMGSGKDGLWLALQVRDRWPPVHIIITSGHRDVTAHMMPADALFIAKPYLDDHVIREMQRMTT
jgi:DNA-binding NtrC family response regulator